MRVHGRNLRQAPERFLWRVSPEVRSHRSAPQAGVSVVETEADFPADRMLTGALLVPLGMMALNGVEYLVPQFLLVTGELSPLKAGLCLLPSAIGLIAGSQLTPALSRRVRPPC
ncbi:hypothetical protein [Streptomyces sp. NPDC045251]|uniref:hypothetical protein n=1 Tax=unclassified Streptomyces TaxID=2593676 RepID=UPI003410857B